MQSAIISLAETWFSLQPSKGAMGRAENEQFYDEDWIGLNFVHLSLSLKPGEFCQESTYTVIT